MIQRIQSVWLLLATLALVLMLVFPIATKEVGGMENRLLSTGIYQSAANGKEINLVMFFPLLISNIVIAAICLINIFNFKKRALQKRLAIITILLTGGFAFWCSIYARRIPSGLEGAHFGIGAYLPALAILCCVLAIFGINKDERLIRSAERLR